MTVQDSNSAIQHYDAFGRTSRFMASTVSQ